MEFTKEQILQSLKDLIKSKALSNDELIGAIRSNITKGNISELDVVDMVEKLKPTSYDEEGNVINKFELINDEYVIAFEKYEAIEYLKSTDWIIVKISEKQIEGVDISDLLNKYKEQFDKRKELRELL